MASMHGGGAGGLEPQSLTGASPKAQPVPGQLLAQVVWGQILAQAPHPHLRGGVVVHGGCCTRAVEDLPRGSLRRGDAQAAAARAAAAAAAAWEVA